MDFCFVNMPYAEIHHPSLALGLLQAIIEREGFTSESIYANLIFGNEIGLQAYSNVSMCPAQYELAGWTFAQAAFPDFKSDDKLFLESIMARNHSYQALDQRQFFQQMLEVRVAATAFVEKMAQKILARQPRIVGCTSLAKQHVSSLALLKRIHEINPEVITVMGGPNCETIMGKTTHESFAWVDYVISGEADELIAPLTKNILEYGRNIPAAKLSYGVFAPAHRQTGYPQKVDCKGQDDAPRAVVASLENQPIPNFFDYFSLLPQMSKLKIDPGLIMESSRGCWWGQKSPCKFCGLNGDNYTYRKRPFGDVIKELKELSARHNTYKVAFTDNIMDMGYFNDFLPELAKLGAPYSIFFEIKANLKKYHLKTLRDAGVRFLQPGIESLHGKILDLMNKGCKPWHVIQLLKWSRHYGLWNGWNLLCGFPGEDDAVYQEMAEFMPLLTHLQPPGAMVAVRFDRYSHYFNFAEQYGLSIQPGDLYAFTYPLAPEKIADIAYFFDDKAQINAIKNPVLAALMKKPGLTAAKQAFIDWTKLYWSKEQPLLSLRTRETNGLTHSTICDTRPVAVKNTYELVGLEQAVYTLCDEAQSLGSIFRAIGDTSGTVADIKAALEYLITNKLMLKFDDKYLALAVEEPCSPLPSIIEFPGGKANLAEK